MSHILGLFAVLSLISVCVIFLVILPPLNDYPNHLARMHILSDLHQSAALQRYYRNVMLAQPNLAMDLIVPILATVIPLELAGKIFIAATIVLTSAGVLALHHAIHRRWSVWPCMAFLFAYHRMLLWGLLNFCFGLGAALCATAVWMHIRTKPAWLRIIVSSVCAAIVYLCHLYAFGIYALTIGGIELFYVLGAGLGSKAAKTLLVALVQFVLPAYFFIALSGAPAAISETRWGSLWGKFEAPFDVIYQYHLVFDVLCLLAILGFAAWAIHRKAIAIAWPLVPAIAILMIVFFLMPDELFSGWGVDRRMPIAILLLSIAACDWKDRGVWWRDTIVLAMIALLVLRMALLAQVWHRSDAVYARYFEAIGQLPEGARVLPVTLYPYAQSLQPIPTLEGACLAIVERDAFVPSLFTSPPLSSESVSFSQDFVQLGTETHFHIIRKKDIPALWTANGAGAKRLFDPALLAKFDYVFVTKPDALPSAAYPSFLKVVAHSPEFAIYEIAHE